MGGVDYFFVVALATPVFNRLLQSPRLLGYVPQTLFGFNC
jgi:hypothetical protein